MNDNMIIPEKFLIDEQDPKVIDKILPKLHDMLSSNEELIYLAVQKRPAVNLMPDCIAVSNKRIFYCMPTNFGITMNFKDISWKSVKEVSFKEEIFGSKFICVPQQGENIITEYIPKVQARKLYQAANEQLENFKVLQAEQLEAQQKTRIAVPEPTDEIEEAPHLDVDVVEVPASLPLAEAVAQPEKEEEPEDETTLKLRKLKSLYDKQLITQQEYEAKKAAILDSF
jgi:hypothetical protein